MTVRAPIVGLPVQMSIPDGSVGQSLGSFVAVRPPTVNLFCFPHFLSLFIVSFLGLKLSSSGWISLVLTQSRCAD